MKNFSFRGLNSCYDRHRNTVDAVLLIAIIFIVSRIAFFTTAMFTIFNWNEYPYNTFGLKEVLGYTFSLVDGSYFYQIVNDGTYSWNPAFVATPDVIFSVYNRYNIAHMFLHPFLSWIVMKITGLSAFLSIGLWNNIASFISYILVCKIIYKLTNDRQKSIAGVLLLAFHPYNYCMTAGISEGTFVMLTAIMILALLKDKYVLAAIAGGALNATQLRGLFAPILIIIAYFLISKNKITIKNIAKAAGLSALSLWGFIAKGIYTYIYCGDFFYTFYANHAWASFEKESSLKNFINFFTLGEYRHQNYEVIGFVFVCAIAI